MAKRQSNTAHLIHGYADAEPRPDDISASMELAIRERIRWQADKRKLVEGYDDKAAMRLSAYIGGLNWVLERAGKKAENV